MKYTIVCYDLFPPFEIIGEKVNILAIEKPSELYSFVNELHHQINGENGKIVVSQDNKPIKLSAKVELLTHLIPFEINSKKMLTKLYSYFSRKLQEAENFEEGIKLQEAVSSFMSKLTQCEMIETEFDSVDVVALFKAVDFRLNNESNSLEDQLIEYMTCVRELDGEKIFVFVNLLSYIDADKRHLLYKTITDHDFCVILLEHSAVEPSNSINQMIIDEDLCVI